MQFVYVTAYVCVLVVLYAEWWGPTLPTIQLLQPGVLAHVQVCLQPDLEEIRPDGHSTSVALPVSRGTVPHQTVLISIYPVPPHAAAHELPVT